jgi:predicted DNA-binding ribbon-helix-helix protein
MNPSVDGIKNLVACVEEEHAEYYNLGKAVRGIMKRTLTEEEETLVKKLGANA